MNEREVLKPFVTENSDPATARNKMSFVGQPGFVDPKFDSGFHPQFQPTPDEISRAKREYGIKYLGQK